MQPLVDVGIWCEDEGFSGQTDFIDLPTFGTISL
jgi:hypothetical protein